MKKLISFIISLSMFCSIVPVHAEDNISNINIPTSNCELGYIFSVSDNNFNGLTPDDYDGIIVISEELNIYYAQDLKSFKNVASKFDVADYEENFIIETPDLPEEDFSQEISLFDDGDGDTNEPEPTIEPVSSENPTETIAPDTTETPEGTEAPQLTEEPVETETPENTEEPSETIEPTQTDAPVENVDREETPTISIAYRSNSLSGFIANNIYTINGEEITPNGGLVSIDDSWYGTTISIVKKSTSDELLDSEPQELYIPEIPDAPTNVSVRYKETYYGIVAIVSFDNPDKIYASCKKVGEFRETAGGSMKTQFTLTDDGVYEIYYHYTDTAFASKSAIVEVEGLYKVDSREPTIDTDDPLAEWQWYYEAVNANAYRENDITGKGVKVGIIDSGIRTDREDFEGVDIETGLNVCAYVMNDEERLYATIDAENHGTGVTSIIAAKSNNSAGITGMVNDCTIVPYRIEDQSYSRTGLTGASLIKAIQLAYDNNCDVVNISYGGTMSSDIYINQIVDNCIKDGMIIIAAAGNSGNKENLNEIEYPAACTNVIGVGAVQPDCEMEDLYYEKETRKIITKDEFYNLSVSERGHSYSWFAYTVKNLSSNSYVKCDFSTANESVFISAPGEDMILISNQSASEYHSGNGTSYATPIVTAAVAGIKQIRPYVDTDMVKEILKATAVDLDEEGYDINTGYGMVDFEAIYNYVSEMPETIPEETPEIKIDYEKNQLIGFVEDAEYLINGVSVTPEEGSIAIDDTWYGSTISVVRKSRGNGYSDSEAQKLIVPAIPDAPTGVSTGYNKIIGTTTDMEYKSSASDTWVSCNGTEVTNLNAGTYDVRIKATSTSFASNSVQVEVLDLPIKPTTPPLEKEYVIETSVKYDEANNRVVFSTTNNTDNTIYAAGVVAVYDTNGILKYIKTVKTFPKETLNQSFAYDDANCKIKFFIWKDMQSLQPYPDVKCSEYSVSEGV